MTDTAFSHRERELELRKLDNELNDEKVKAAEKKALIAEAKRRYGSGWRKILGLARGMKPNAETIQTLYSMGGSGRELRDLSKPRGMRKSYED